MQCEGVLFRMDLSPWPSTVLSVGMILLLSASVCHSTIHYVEITEMDETQIVNIHNARRSLVTPFASNMNQLAWSDALANLSSKILEDCSYGSVDTSALDLEEYGLPFSNIGANLAVVPGYEINYEDILDNWYSERDFYSYSSKSCAPQCTCIHYLQMVWAESCVIGCAVNYCYTIDGYRSDSEGDTDGTLFLCLYGPSNLTSNDDCPYMEGMPCDDCPDDRSMCVTSTLCAPDDMQGGGGADPHYLVLLPGGERLCFSVQGEEGKIFNLLSNDMVQVNALYVADPEVGRRVTWLGSIGINILGKKFQFDLAQSKIHIGERVSLDAYKVNSISLFDGHFVIREGKHSPDTIHNVEVDLQDVNLKFVVSFVKGHHLDLFWHIAGEIHRAETHGIIGQFFREGVEIDTEKEMLHLPGRSSVPVTRQRIWKFMTSETQDESGCWTTPKRTKQAKGLIEGCYQDYEVYNLVSTGFKFGGNLEQ